MQPPETKYTKLGDSQIAYQVFGEGPIDLVYITGFASHIDVRWENPLFAQMCSRLAMFSRVIMFDRRGTGASDPLPLDALPTWEDWTEDTRAVMDVAGSQRAAISASLDAGPMGMLFAATRPERVSALILWNTSARRLIAPDYPFGVPPEVVDALVMAIAEGWGTEGFAAASAPTRAQDAEYIRWAAKFMRAAATPRVAAAQERYSFGLDARSVLPLIQVPTLIMNVSDLAQLPPELGRYLAQHIPGARFVELPGAALYPPTDQQTTDAYIDHVEEFLTGARRAPEPDRVLATVLFTDIVGSTERAGQLGDRRWKELLDRFDGLSRGEIEKVGGRVVNTTGDGHLATFDGPGKAIRCARSLIGAVQPLGIQIRAGLHTGEVEVRGPNVGGIAVHIGARVVALAGPSEVLVSRTVSDLVAGSGIEFDDRGAHELKGVPGDWHLFAVRS